MRFFLLFTCLFLIGNLQAQNSEAAKLSASTQQYLWKQKELYSGAKILPECVYRQDANGRIYIASLIQVKPTINQADLEALDIMIGSKSKDIWTAYVPLEQVKAFSELPGIAAIELDRPTGIMMDSARVHTHTDSVHNGINLPQAYDGKGVVVGVIDAGFDYTHPANFDTSYTHFRLKSVWEQKGTGTAPAGFGFGAEYIDSTSIFNKGFDLMDFSHGTHVGGIAGGSGYGGPAGDNERFRGMAYNSDLVYVGILPELNMWLNTGLTDMIDGINYIYDYATAVNKPAVANLSWGNPIGPHDGLALFSQACDNATGPGKIFVLSAGNNAGRRVHLQKTFNPSDTMVRTVLDFGAGLPSKTNWVDIWGDTAHSFCLEFELRNILGTVDNSITYCIDDQTHQVILIGNNNDTCFITLTSVSSDINGKTHILLDVYSRVPEKLIISVIGQTGTVDMWQGYVLGARGYYGAFSKDVYSFTTSGDDAMSASDMASTHSAIAVGAYTSKAAFTNLSGNSMNFGQSIYDIATFSSKGPTADGRTKPNITGPGTAIGSAINSVDPGYASGGGSSNSVMSEFVSPLNGTTYSYAMSQGTSMSSPAVAGIVALMLQVNPSLTPSQIQTILYNTAIQDNYTGNISATGDHIWGWGKINAYAAVAASLNITGIYHESNTMLQALLYPNPSKDNYRIELQTNKSETITIGLIDITGRSLDQIEWNVHSGVNSIQPNWNKLAPGIYFVHLKGQDGEMNIKWIKI
jgi:minor extracellular serine protease Vpr